MLVLLKSAAILTGAIFAGAAVYINVVEHPARMTLDTKAAALEWVPSYSRATWTQAPHVLLSLFARLGSWLLGGGSGWAIAALLIGAVVPFTFLGIMPTNKALLSPGRDLTSSETRELLVRWASFTPLGRCSVSPPHSYMCLSRLDPNNRVWTPPSSGDR